MAESDEEKLSAVLELTFDDIKTAVREWIAARTSTKVGEIHLFSDDKGIRGTVRFDLRKWP